MSEYIVVAVITFAALLFLSGLADGDDFLRDMTFSFFASVVWPVLFSFMALLALTYPVYKLGVIVGEWYVRK